MSTCVPLIRADRTALSNRLMMPAGVPLEAQDYHRRNSRRRCSDSRRSLVTLLPGMGMGFDESSSPTKVTARLPS